jgi:hypothetical protein
MPLLMPLYCLLLTLFTISFEDFLLNQNSLWTLPSEVKFALLNLFVIFTLIAPGISIIVLRNRKMITSIEMEERTQRYFPIMLMFFYSIALFLLLYLKTNNTAIPSYVYTLPLAGAIVSITLFAINFNMKISLHAAGCGILFGFILAYSMRQQYFEFWIVLVAALISGITISARLYLQKHSIHEVYHGWLISVLITFFVNYLH